MGEGVRRGNRKSLHNETKRKLSKSEIEMEFSLLHAFQQHTHKFHLECNFSCVEYAGAVTSICAPRPPRLYRDVHMKFACSRFITIVIVFLRFSFYFPFPSLLSVCSPPSTLRAPRVGRNRRNRRGQRTRKKESKKEARINHPNDRLRRVTKLR